MGQEDQEDQAIPVRQEKKNFIKVRICWMEIKGKQISKLNPITVTNCQMGYNTYPQTLYITKARALHVHKGLQIN